MADYLAVHAPPGTPRDQLRLIAAEGGFPDDMSDTAMRLYRDVALVVPVYYRHPRVYLSAYRYLKENTRHKTLYSIMRVVDRALADTPENEMVGRADIVRVLA